MIEYYASQFTIQWLESIRLFLFHWLVQIKREDEEIAMAVEQWTVTKHVIRIRQHPQIAETIYVISQCITELLNTTSCPRIISIPSRRRLGPYDAKAQAFWIQI